MAYPHDQGLKETHLFNKDTFRSLMIILMYLKQDHLFNRTVQAVSVTSTQTVQLNSNMLIVTIHAVYNV